MYWSISFLTLKDQIESQDSKGEKGVLPRKYKITRTTNNDAHSIIAILIYEKDGKIIKL